MINKTNMARYLLVLVLVVALVFGEEIDPEFKRITCGSSIKLINKQTGYRVFLFLFIFFQIVQN